jgi:hypothetical protein
VTPGEGAPVDEPGAEVATDAGQLDVLLERERERERQVRAALLALPAKLREAVLLVIGWSC